MLALSVTSEVREELNVEFGQFTTSLVRAVVHSILAFTMALGRFPFDDLWALLSPALWTQVKPQVSHWAVQKLQALRSKSFPVSPCQGEAETREGL